MKKAFSTYLKSDNPWVGLGVILAAALILRIPHLTESIWLDELWSTKVKLGSFGDLLNTMFSDIHPPVYNVLMFVWIHLFGDSELSIRIPSLVFGLGGIALTFLVARHYFGRNVGLLAAALLAISPPHIWYSQEARGYTLLMFLILLAVYAFARYEQDRERKGWFWTYAASLLVAVFTHYYAVAFVGFMGLLSLRSAGGNAKNKRVLLAGLVTLAGLAALVGVKLATGVLRTSSVYLREFDLFELWMLVFNWLPTGNAIWPVNMWAADFSLMLQQPALLTLQLFMLCLLLAGMADSLFRKRPETPGARFFSGYLLCVPLLLLVVSLLGLGRNFAARSGLVALPFFLILVANGVFTVRIRPARMAVLAVLGFFCLASLTGYFRKPDQWTVYKPNPDWRSAAVYLSAELDKAPGREAVLAKTPARALTYYDHRFHDWAAGSEVEAPQAVKYAIRYLGDADADEDPALIFAEPPEALYLIHNKYWSFDVGEAQREITRRLGMRQAFIKEFKGLQIFTYKK